MYVVLVSSCEKKAIRKTRKILDAYAIRVSKTTWSSKITMLGVKAIEQELKQIATRQTSVACYVNNGYNNLKLLWVIGSKTHYLYNGQYPIKK
jgi:CRISPR-associated endonuclease/helicase Cas3